MATLAGCDASTTTVVNIIKLQNQVIERQNTVYIIDIQFHNYLKTELVNRIHPCKCTGVALKHGYDALDAPALDALEAKENEKEAEEEKK